MCQGNPLAISGKDGNILYKIGAFSPSRTGFLRYIITFIRFTGIYLDRGKNHGGLAVD